MGVSGLRTSDNHSVAQFPHAPVQDIGTALAHTQRMLAGALSRQARDEARIEELERALASAEALAAQSDHDSKHDPLTGLANRRLLVEKLNSAIADAQRCGTLVGVLMLDLDGFKEVNDRLGHAAGDTALVRVAHALRGCVRSGDTVARLGGDEFVVVIPNLGTTSTAATVASTIQRRVRVVQRAAGSEIALSASLGIAVYPGNGESCETLLRYADEAMYDARSRARGCVDRRAAAPANLYQFART